MATNMLKPLFVTLTAVLLISACAKSPTGRNQIKLYSSAQLANMGSQAFDNMKSEQKVSKKQVNNDYVNCVANAITRNVPKSVFAGEWEVVVFEDEQVNAFALPGGKIGVYTGLLKIADNQDQLAAVIGHEVGHVIAEHGNERMSNSALVNAGMQVTNQLLKTNEVAYSKDIMAAIGLGVQVGVTLPFSRTHETEADIIGLELMAKSGFAPEQSVNLWQNMDKANQGQRPPEFMSTHPSPQSRIQALKQHIPQAKRLQQQASARPQCG